MPDIPQNSDPTYRPQLVRDASRSIGKGSKSFALASRLFDRTTRERAWLLYAWCRACDDIADDQEYGYSARRRSAQAHPTAIERLSSIRSLTHQALAGQATGSPAFDALGQLSREVPLDAAVIDDVLAGFALDAEGWLPRSEAQMLRYCYHVAGAVGVLMALVMGVPADDDETLDRACDLGIAFQLANIVRDVSDDAALGRCYLPLEWLSEADIPPGEATKPHYRAALIPLIARACALAREYEASARIGAHSLRWRHRWAVLSAANIYGQIGNEVERLGHHAWDRRVGTTTRQKVTFIIRACHQSVAGPPPQDMHVRIKREGLRNLARQYR